MRILLILLTFAHAGAASAHHALSADYEPGNSLHRGCHNPTVITKIDCDPYTFFRARDLESQLEEFWSRSKYRR